MPPAASTGAFRWPLAPGTRNSLYRCGEGEDGTQEDLGSAVHLWRGTSTNGNLTTAPGPTKLPTPGRLTSIAFVSNGAYDLTAHSLRSVFSSCVILKSLEQTLTGLCDFGHPFLSILVKILGPEICRKWEL
jgi:hypothetical protein